MCCNVAQLLIVLEYTLHFKEYATPPHIHPMSRNITAWDQFYQTFLHDSTASDKCWGEKALVQGSANHTHNNNNVWQEKACA